MTITIREAAPDERDEVSRVLLLAEPSASALRWSLENLSDVVYRMDVDGELVGAASMRWGDECELVELAVVESRQGQGLGRQLVAWLLDEARRRGSQAMIVGTRNSSIGNIAFYQKCGFRMDRVRQDYFWYYRTPMYENGIQARDMLVFRHELTDAPPRRRRGR